MPALHLHAHLPGEIRIDRLLAFIRFGQAASSLREDFLVPLEDKTGILVVMQPLFHRVRHLGKVLLRRDHQLILL